MILSFWMSCFFDIYREVENCGLSEVSKEIVMLMYID